MSGYELPSFLLGVIVGASAILGAVAAYLRSHLIP
jgi:hypothetical protein